MFSLHAGYVSFVLISIVFINYAIDFFEEPVLPKGEGEIVIFGGWGGGGYVMEFYGNNCTPFSPITITNHRKFTSTYSASIASSTGSRNLLDDSMVIDDNVSSLGKYRLAGLSDGPRLSALSWDRRDREQMTLNRLGVLENRFYDLEQSTVERNLFQPPT